MVALRFGEEDHEEGHKPLKPFGALVKFNFYAEVVFNRHFEILAPKRPESARRK